MNKPITVAREEFMSGLIHFINEASMPAFVVKDVFRELLPQLETNAQKEYDADLQQYATALQEEQSKTDDSMNSPKKKK